MKRKNGFTLIELLAVIVILAIIALIATPIILGVIETARKGAAESSALGYVDAVEKQIAINILDSDEKNNIVDDTYTVEKLTEKGVTIKGNPPTGKVIIKDGRVVDYTLVVDGKYTITPTSTGVNGSSDVAKVCKIADGSTIVDVGTEIDCAGERFYVYDPSDDDGNIKMLAKYNLKVGGTYNSGYVEYSEDEMTYKQDESMVGNKGVTPYGTSNVYSGSILETYVNKYSEILESKGVNLVDASLVTVEGLKRYNCVNDGTSIRCDELPDFFNRSYGIWIGTQGPKLYAFTLYNNNFGIEMYYDYQLNHVRPTITIAKSEIK